MTNIQFHVNTATTLHALDNLKSFLYKLDLQSNLYKINLLKYKYEICTIYKFIHSNT